MQLIARRLIGRLTYANVLATLAIFCALGGVAWALATNSVKSRHIAPEAVRSSDIKNQGVRKVDLAPAARSPLSVAYDEVATGETTTSTEFTDLATPGPTVEVRVPEDALVSVTTQIYYFAPEWSNTLSCTARVVATPNPPETGVIGEVTGSGMSAGFFEDVRRTHVRIPAGTYEFTLKYKREGGGTCGFSERKLWVEVTAPPA